MLFVLHYLPALLWSVSRNTFQSGYGPRRRRRNHAQYGYARLYQRAQLHVEISIPEQVTFGLPAMATLYEEQLNSMLNSTHLEPAQTLAEFLAELHVHFPLAHDVLAKFLSSETILRQVRFLLGTPFRGGLDSCRLRPVSSFA